MNKDFQAFVVRVSETIRESSNQPGPVPVEELMKKNVANGTGTLQDALGDIISSIRQEAVALWVNFLFINFLSIH